MYRIEALGSISIADEYIRMAMLYSPREKAASASLRRTETSPSAEPADYFSRSGVVKGTSMVMIDNSRASTKSAATRLSIKMILRFPAVDAQSSWRGVPINHRVHTTRSWSDRVGIQSALTTPGLSTYYQWDETIPHRGGIVLYRHQIGGGVLVMTRVLDADPRGGDLLIIGRLNTGENAELDTDMK